MIYYQVKLDFYSLLTKDSFIEGELLTENELIKKYKFTRKDLIPSEQNIFRKISTPQSNTYKSFGVRKIKFISKVKVLEV